MRKMNGLHEYWWDGSVGSDRVGQLVSDTVKYLDDNQRYRRDAILDAMRLYGNADIAGLSGFEYARSRSGGDLKLNLVRSVIDTLCAHIATNKTRPMFLTSKGDYEQQTRAKRLNRFASGALYETEFYSRIAPRVFRDAALFGKGFAKWYAGPSGVKAERVFPGEIIVDDVEARDGCPRMLIQHKEVAREVLVAKFPERERDILNSRLVRERSNDSRSHLADPTSIMEAWHLPSGPEAGDGRRVLCLSEGDALDDVEWDGARFPFSGLDWVDPLLGWWPVSLVAELEGLQVEINYILQKIQRLMTLATSQVWMQKGSGINSSKLSNDDWAVNEYEGAPPIFMTVSSVSPEYFSHLDRLWNRGFEIAGISQLAAQAKKPGGLNSGTALREYKDAQSQRFLDLEQAYEKFHLDSVRQAIEVAKQIDEDSDDGYSVLAKGSRDVERIKWSEVELDDDSYVLQAYPANLLPTMPAARIELAGELAAQFPEIKPYLLSLFEFPDVEAAVSLANADIEYIDMLIEAMVERGEYYPPEPQANLALSIQRMTQRYLRGRIEGAPEDRLALLLDYMAQAQAMLNPPTPPAAGGPMSPGPEGAAPPPGAEGMMPPGMGAPAPDMGGGMVPPPVA